jgi:hypothetical protein
VYLDHVESMSGCFGVGGGGIVGVHVNVTLHFAMNTERTKSLNRGKLTAHTWKCMRLLHHSGNIFACTYKLTRSCRPVRVKGGECSPLLTKSVCSERRCFGFISCELHDRIFFMRAGNIG